MIDFLEELTTLEDLGVDGHFATELLLPKFVECLLRLDHILISGDHCLRLFKDCAFVHFSSEGGAEIVVHIEIIAFSHFALEEPLGWEDQSRWDWLEHLAVLDYLLVLMLLIIDLRVARKRLVVIDPRVIFL